MKNKNTPMMEQYIKIKKNYSDAFLFYRVGDFYELFNDDAIKGAKLLELTLTSRNKNSSNNIPMCGVPYHSVQNYINVLVDKGYKVAICDQVENPAEAQGTVKREVTQVITPGIRINNKSDENNYISVLLKKNGLYGFAYSDISTGEIYSTHLESFEEVLDEINSIQTKELVLDESIDSKDLILLKKIGVLISKYDDNKEFDEFEFTKLVSNISNNLEKDAILLLIAYMQNTQKRSLSYLQSPVSYIPNNFLRMDRYARKNLELIVNNTTNKHSGTLLWIINETKTAMGGRLLKQWLERPLLSKEKILNRQNIVQEFIDNYFERANLQDSLEGVYDLERLVSKVSFGNANAKDLIQLKNSLKQVPKIVYSISNLNSKYFSKLISEIYNVDDLVEMIESSIIDDPPLSITEGNIIKDGFSDSLDEYRNIINNNQQWIANLEAKERKLTGIKKLKIGYNKVFGYYIEVSKNNIDKVPTERYIRKQTLTNSERFSTVDLKERESKILEAESKTVALEYDLFNEIRNKLKNSTEKLQKIAKSIAELDVLQSFANVSEKFNFTRPIINNGHNINIIDGRHPVVERVIGRENYVPNDILLSKNNNIQLITGPNMSGKSTYMRQLALIVILTQIGCFVPAKEASLPIFDQIFTRIGAADDLVSGNSTFMVEMQEANDALRNATENSLIIFDEIGRGTATYDGMALAQSIIEYIHNNIHAKTLFSTHYHELTLLEKKLPELVNVHVGAIEKNGELIFLHKVKNGAVDKSYGIHVAKLAGLPNDLLQRAKDILQILEQEDHQKVNEDSKQLTLFDSGDSNSQILRELKKIDLMNITPLELMNKIDKLKRKIDD
ncbi:MAG: DNA mismatch repair protein MutS [Firmicutes bacterium]|uniref:DNA mismatch repair protein MutS n=1 Tax=Candidatus Gallilactobacillus intestinavium TaxID=2840838 RepID=A0A9D9E6W7_9LACO|nr:DNA mismatch repair protein MutS [Candidatus Gallilactobacillus intestinavium]